MKFQKRGRVSFHWGISIACGFFVLAGTLIYLSQYVDAVRVHYKRLKQPDPYVFEEIDPKYLSVDPAQFVTLEKAADLKNHRRRLRDLLIRQRSVGPDYTLYRPGEYEISEYEGRYWTPILAELNEWDGLREVRRIKLELERNHLSGKYPRNAVSNLHHLVPETPNGKGIIYHHGFGDGYWDTARLLERFLLEGYAVLVINHFGYGDNELSYKTTDCVEKNQNGICILNHHYDIDRLERAFYYQMMPVIAGLDYLSGELPSGEIDMIGFSSGAPTAVVAAAMDPRIRHVFAIAGVYPDYLREGEESGVGIANYSGMRAIASMMDLFVLSADRPGRRSVQVFNQYDRCCYRNRKASLYEQTVREFLSKLQGRGAFEIWFDESHADHKVSDWAVSKILRVIGE